MAKVALLNTKGENLGEVDLSDEVFGAEVNEALLHESVVAYETNQRAGNVQTKERGDVRGGGKKPWRQKGTGRARAGSSRSPVWRKGGVTFGPHPRDFEMRLNKKARRAALRSALTSKVQAGSFILLDQLALTEPRTREMARILANLKVADDKALVVTAVRDNHVELASRNIAGVKAEVAVDVNVRDVLAHDYLVMTKDAADVITEVLTK